MSEFTPDIYWPLGSTLQGTDFSSDANYYRHFGILSTNPVNGHIVILYRRGTTHALDYGIIFIRHSSDGGFTWSDEVELFTEQNVDLRNIAGGYDSNERLFLFYARYNYAAQPPNPKWLSMNYRYSDDDGQNWSNQQTLTTSLSGFSPYGHIVDAGNGVLYQPWYENNYDGSNVQTCSYKINLCKSTNGGSSFSSVIEIYSHTNSGEQFLYTEFSLVNVGGGCFIVIARKDGPDFQEYHQFKSENNCQNWDSQGDTASLLSTYPAPPWLSFINYEGIGIVACYFTDRGAQKLRVIYGLAKDLLDNGPSGWNANTIKEIFDFWYPLTPPPQYRASGYQSFFHPLNQYKGIGVAFKEILDDYNEQKSYPIVPFTNILGMNDVLIALGL